MSSATCSHRERRLRYFGRADIASGSAAILDHDRLAPALGESLRQDARDDIGGAAGRERHDDATPSCSDSSDV